MFLISPKIIPEETRKSSVCDAKKRDLLAGAGSEIFRGRGRECCFGEKAPKVRQNKERSGGRCGH